MCRYFIKIQLYEMSTQILFLWYINFKANNKIINKMHLVVHIRVMEYFYIPLLFEK